MLALFDVGLVRDELVGLAASQFEAVSRDLLDAEARSLLQLEVLRTTTISLYFLRLGRPRFRKREDAGDQHE